MRIVIGEDSALFREGLTRLLVDTGQDVVATASDATALLDAVRRHRPTVAIIDVRMPPDHTDDGARAAAQARTEFPDLGIVLLSQHVETRYSVDLVTTGRFGYLLKDRVLDVENFVESLERVASGGSALDPEVVSRLLSARRGSAALEALTARELEVLGLMAEGHTNAGIAKRLWLTERTVETHVSSILGKIGKPAPASPTRRGAGVVANEAPGHRRVLAVLAFLDARQRG